MLISILLRQIAIMALLAAVGVYLSRKAVSYTHLTLPTTRHV